MRTGHGAREVGVRDSPTVFGDAQNGSSLAKVLSAGQTARARGPWRRPGHEFQITAPLCAQASPPPVVVVPPYVAAAAHRGTRVELGTRKLRKVS